MALLGRGSTHVDEPEEHTMANISIIGTGNMGQAIAAVAGRGGHTVHLLGRDDLGSDLGDVVVLAVP